MGQIESFKRPSFVANAEKTEHIREILQSDFTVLLKEGGIVTATGTHLNHLGEEIITLLPRNLQEELNRKRVLRVNVSQIKKALQVTTNTEEFGSTRAYIFAQNAIDGLSYSETRGGSITPLFINEDGTTIVPHSMDHHFPTYFVNRARNILHHEKILGSHYRFATSILKNIANSSGLGNIRDVKARTFIKEHTLKIF